MHLPVLVDEVLQVLEPEAGENFIDCTLGAGGHTKAILQKTAPNGKVLAIEWDPETLEQTRQDLAEFKDRITFVPRNYADLKEIVKAESFGPVHGILLDLGFSSLQLEQRGRGFSFKRDEPLDMRYDPGLQLTAREIVNRWPEPELARILKEYGEERFAKRIAAAIAERRQKQKVQTTGELVEIIQKAVPGFYRRDPNMAQKTFQALRITTNAELENLKAVLPQAEEILEEGGRIAAISFHSLEDRIVKHFFKNSERLFVLTKKPIVSSEQEVQANPRSRSAKLRAARKETS